MLMRPVVFQVLIYSLVDAGARVVQVPAPEEKAEIRWRLCGPGLAWLPGISLFSSITSRALIFPSPSRHAISWLALELLFSRAIDCTPCSHGTI